MKDITNGLGSSPNTEGDERETRGGQKLWKKISV